MATTTVPKAARDQLPVSDPSRAGGLTFAQFIEIISGQAELPAADVSMADIIAQTLAASSLEEGLGEKTAVSLREHIGGEIVLHGFRLNRSDERFSDSGGVYVAMDVTLVDTGERVIMTSGAGRVLAACGLCLKLGQWDEHFRITSTPTDTGSVYSLVHVPVVHLKDGSTF